MFPRMVRPFAVFGIRQTQVATPFVTVRVTAAARLPASVAAQPTVPDLTGPAVSFSFAASETENVRPAFAGFGDVVKAVTVSTSFVSTWYEKNPCPGSGAASRWMFVKSGLPEASTVAPETAITLKLNALVLFRSAARTWIVAPFEYAKVSEVCDGAPTRASRTRTR